MEKRKVFSQQFVGYDVSIPQKSRDNYVLFAKIEGIQRSISPETTTVATQMVCLNTQYTQSAPESCPYTDDMSLPIVLEMEHRMSTLYHRRMEESRILRC
ncbi:hypothetical protein TNCV_4554201 [Trichonephila clavipes]|nr:hypothetical protein TNCV_4554201 [Trichonephila clavipes]